MSGRYRFEGCEECKKRLPVSNEWEDGTKIQCDNCGNVQSVDTDD